MCNESVLHDSMRGTLLHIVLYSTALHIKIIIMYV